MVTRVKDITNCRFGRLVAKRRVLTEKGYRWECLCDCGKTTFVALGNLGNVTNSCGCLRKDIMHVIKSKSLQDVVHRQILGYYLRNARTRNIEWVLTTDEFTRLIHEPCYYCGVIGGSVTKYSNPTQRMLLGEPSSINNNGIDRIDNSLGYTSTNVVTACKRCNQAKNNMTQSEFINWIKRLHDNMQEKGVF